MERIRQRRGTKFQQGGEKETPQSQQTFINPFSYESAPEARVQLELEYRHVRFAYRYFADSGSAVRIHKLIPDFAPEFTLPDFKTVIIIQGDFYGSLPGVINQAALAQVLLHADGWKTAIWTQSEIVNLGAAALMRRDLPELERPAHIGPEIESPYPRPLTMETRRRYLRGLALLKQIFAPKKVLGALQEGTLRGLTRRIRRDNTDSNRHRSSSAAHRIGDD